MRKLDRQDKSVESARWQSLRPLLSLLQEEGNLLERMLTLAGQERTATRTRDLAKLEKAISSKKDVLDRVDAIEQQRKQLLDDWAGQNGFATGALTMSALIDLSPDEKRADLARAHERLNRLVAAVSESNEQNAAMLVRLLSNVQQSLSFVVGLQSRDFAYSASGSTVTASRNSKRLIEHCV
ncbi:MAG: flagellar protein FlgN [Chloroflexi bacterium]|nr:flagellar protein FlgN [Chloroflexota bacterium]